jgi:hypothetical protein
MARRFNRQPLTDEERDARRKADRDRMEQAARGLLATDGWQRWIKVRASNGLSRYSLGNQMILAIEAYRRGITLSYVAGFRAWLQLNRVPRKGEGIRILAPVAVKDCDEHGEETGGKRVFFKSVTVWDVTGTDQVPGTQPVPLTPPAEPITGDSHYRCSPTPPRSATASRSATSLSAGPAAGATPSAAGSSSPTAPATSRSARSPTSWPTHTASATSSTREPKPRSSSTPSPTSSAPSASMSAANRSPTSPAGAKTARSTQSATTRKRST